MATKKGRSARPVMGKINAVLPVELITKIAAARAALRSEGVAVSYSSFVEVATTELLARRDLADILEKRGATAKRG